MSSCCDLRVEDLDELLAAGRRSRRGRCAAGAASENSAASGSTNRLFTMSRTACAASAAARSCRRASAPSGPCRTWSHVSSSTLCTAVLADRGLSRGRAVLERRPELRLERVESAEERRRSPSSRASPTAPRASGGRRRDAPARAWPRRACGSRVASAASGGSSAASSRWPSAAAVVELDGVAERRSCRLHRRRRARLVDLGQDRLEPGVESRHGRRDRAQHLVRLLEHREAVVADRCRLLHTRDRPRRERRRPPAPEARRARRRSSSRSRPRAASRSRPGLRLS